MRQHIRKLSVGVALLSLSALPALAAQVELVSVRAPGLATAPAGETLAVELSADGRWAALTLSVDDPDNLHYSLDVFLQNVDTGESMLASHNLSGGRGNDVSVAHSISADGRFVVFESTASDLAAGDDNEASDVFIFDRTSGQVTAASRTGAGFGNGDSYPLGISPDARFIAFESEAGNLAGNLPG